MYILRSFEKYAKTKYVRFLDFDNCHHFSLLLKTGFIISKNQMATNFFPGNWICLPLINLTYFASNVPLEQFRNSFPTFQADWRLKKTRSSSKGILIINVESLFKNPKTKVLPLTREQMGGIKEWCVFSTNALSQLMKLVLLLIKSNSIF